MDFGDFIALVAIKLAFLPYLCNANSEEAQIQKKHSDSSAVGSALRSGRRGRAFESPLSDMNPTFRRPIIRIALLALAWCCGFLFYLLLGESLGTQWTECGIGEWMFTKWQGCSTMLQHRLSGMGLSNETYGQVVALTLGNREFLSPATKQLYREAGASHMLALSGMHLGILYGLLRLIMKHLIYTRWKWMAFGTTMFILWSYAIMTGCPKSLIRAALMLSVALLLHMSGERRKGLDILVVSMAIVFLTDPASLFDIGFQLSCAAMSGIIILGMPLTEHFRKMALVPRLILSSLAISLSAQISTLPFTLWYFGSIATFSALTSLIAIPLTSLAIYLSLGVYAGCGWCVPILEYVIYFQNSIMAFISKLPGAYITL